MHIQEKSKLNLAIIKESCPKLAKIIEQFSHKQKITYDHALHEVLCISSLFGGARTKIEYEGMEWLCGEYYLLVAESSERKTTAVAYLLKYFRKEYNEIASQNEKDRREYSLAYKKYESEVKKGNSYTAPPLQPMICSVMLGSDCTKEGLLTEMLGNNINLKQIASDDAGDFFESIGMKDDGKQRMMIALNKLWSNSDIDETKVKHGGTIRVDGSQMLMNINFSMQGSIFYKHMCSDINKTIGFTARYLMTSAERLAGNRIDIFGASNVDKSSPYYHAEAEKIKEDTIELQEFRERLGTEISALLRRAKERNEKIIPKTKKYSYTASKLLKQIEVNLEYSMAEGAENEFHTELVGKAFQHVINLTAALDWLEGGSKEIMPNVVNTAWQLIEYYIAQHKAMISPEEKVERDMSQGAERVIKWLTKNGHAEYISWKVFLVNCSAIKNVVSEVRDEIIKELEEQKYIEDCRKTRYSSCPPVEIITEEKGKMVPRILKSYIKVLQRSG